MRRLCAVTQRLNDGNEGGRRLAAAWIIQIEPIPVGAKFFQHALELAFGDMRQSKILRHVSEAEPVKGSCDHVVGIVENKLAVGAYSDVLAALLELPGPYSAARRMPVRDAVVADKIVGSGWFGTALEVGRRADDGETDIRSDADRDHVLGELLSHADACVKTLGHDIGEPVVARKLDLDIGIAEQEFFELRPQHAADGVVRGGDPDGAGRLVAQLA